MDNSVDQSLFNEKSLYLLNIKELRLLGRKFGVPSPTSKSKKELVDYILNVIYGKVTIPVRNLYGRHPKSSKQFDMEDFLDKVKKNSDIADKFEYNSSNVKFKEFKVASPSENYALDDEYSRETKIYCFENGKHYLKAMAFIKSENDIELSDEFVKKFGLENFDVVEVTVVDQLIKLVSINGIKCEDKFENLTVSGMRLSSGFSNEFYFETEEDIISETQNLLQKFTEKGIKTLIFTKNDYKNDETIKYSPDEDKTQIYKKIMQFSKICETCIKNGDDIAVIIENYDWLSNIFAKFDISVSVKISKYLNDICSKITKLGNVTLFLNLNDKFEVNY